MIDSVSYDAFHQRCESILSLVRCADVFGLLALSAMRQQDPNLSLIERIIKENGASTTAYTWQWIMTIDERQEFGEKGHLRAICEHIVFASYVALEAYMLGKFQEYFLYLYRAPDSEKLDTLLKRISLRSLDEINRHYKKFLNISVSDFDHPQVPVYEEAPWFHPSSCWEGLKQLESCRNHLAHTGKMRNVKLVVLVDAWSVFEFCQRYVELFECNYNMYIYEGKPVKFER